MKNAIYLLLALVFVQCQDSESSELKTETQEKTVKKKLEQVKKHKIVWHGLHNFTEPEQNQLKNWLREITKVTRSTIGTYQFDVHYYFYHSEAKEPVPYAHTSRKVDKQSVHFYVNPSHSLEDFIGDWTAQHEISHLSIPFIEKKNMWFSEGYATYLSRQIMIKQGYYTDESFDSIYYHRIGNDEYLKNDSDMTLIELCDELKKDYHYSSIYYAGSSFFYLIDQELRTNFNRRLIDVVAQYQEEGRLTDNDLNDVLNSFDKIVGKPIFSDLFHKYATVPSREVLEYFWK